MLVSRWARWRADRDAELVRIKQFDRCQRSVKFEVLKGCDRCPGQEWVLCNAYTATRARLGQDSCRACAQRGKTRSEESNQKRREWYRANGNTAEFREKLRAGQAKNRPSDLRWDWITREWLEEQLKTKSLKMIESEIRGRRVPRIQGPYLSTIAAKLGVSIDKARNTSIGFRASPAAMAAARTNADRINRNPQKKFRRFRYRGISLKSSYELKAAIWLDHNGIGWTYEACKFTMPDGSTYVPDFVLDDGRIIEVKGWSSERFLAQWAQYEANYPAEFARTELWDQAHIERLEIPAHSHFAFDESPARLYRIEQIDYGRAKRLIEAGHYTGYCPSGKHYWGLFDGDVLIGAIVYGQPAINGINIDGHRWPAIIELKRLWIDDCSVKNAESFLIGRTLRLIRRIGYRGVISFADGSVNHTGTIYRACNFVLDGVVAPDYHYEDPYGHRYHKRGVWKQGRINGIAESEQAARDGLVRVEDQTKNRYVIRWDRN